MPRTTKPTLKHLFLQCGVTFYLQLTRLSSSPGRLRRSQQSPTTNAKTSGLCCSLQSSSIKQSQTPAITSCSPDTPPDVSLHITLTQWRRRGAVQPVLLSQVVPSSQHLCGRDHHGHHLVQPALLSQEVSSTPGPDSMGNQVIVYPRQLRENFLVLWQGEGLGGVLNSARRGLRTTEARENWEERKGKKATPEGSKFLTLSHPCG